MSDILTNAREHATANLVPDGEEDFNDTDANNDGWARHMLLVLDESDRLTRALAAANERAERAEREAARLSGILHDRDATPWSEAAIERAALRENADGLAALLTEARAENAALTARVAGLTEALGFASHFATVARTHNHESARGMLVAQVRAALAPPAPASPSDRRDGSLPCATCADGGPFTANCAAKKHEPVILAPPAPGDTEAPRAVANAMVCCRCNNAEADAFPDGRNLCAVCQHARCEKCETPPAPRAEAERVEAPAMHCVGGCGRPAAHIDISPNGAEYGCCGDGACWAGQAGWTTRPLAPAPAKGGV